MHNQLFGQGKQIPALFFAKILQKFIFMTLTIVYFDFNSISK